MAGSKIRQEAEICWGLVVVCVCCEGEDGRRRSVVRQWLDVMTRVGIKIHILHILPGRILCVVVCCWISC